MMKLSSLTDIAFRVSSLISPTTSFLISKTISAGVTLPFP